MLTVPELEANVKGRTENAYSQYDSRNVPRWCILQVKGRTEGKVYEAWR
jgi:hypothetical protein